MASPQLEQGYTRIANELLDALCKLKVSQNKFRIILFIIRNTYGYQRKEAPMSLSYIGTALNIKRHHVMDDLAELEEAKIITIQKHSGITPQVISLNKNYNEWVLPKQVTVPQTGNTTVPQTGNTTVTCTGNQIKKTLKKTLKKDILLIPSFFDDLWQAYPNKKGRNKISKKAYKEIEEAGEARMVKAIENLKEYMAKNTWYHPMYGSTFFNGGWHDYDNNNETTELDTQHAKECENEEESYQ